MMKNNLKWLLLVIIALTPLGCNEDGRATVDVVKNRISNQIQEWVGKGDIAIQKYQNKIKEVRSNLIKVKVSHKTFEQKLLAKKQQLAALEENTSSEQSEVKITILANTIREMETFLQQLSVAETKMEDTYKKLVENLDVVKMKVAALEARRDMLDAMQTVQQYTNFEGEIDGIGGDMDSTLEQMQQEIYAIEAEIEVEKLLNQAEQS
jgi:phage shock protein A